MKTRFQNYLNRLFHQPMVEHYQTPLRRRAVAVGVIICQLLVVCAFMLIRHDMIWPVIVVGVVMIYFKGMLNMSTRGIFELKDGHLDEFQIALRDSAYRKAYFFALLWLLLVAPVAGVFKGDESSLHYIFSFVLLGFFWGMSAPRVFVAWTLPAELVED